MSNNSFSVILTAYSGTDIDLFKKCISSLSTQTLLPDDLILSIDGEISDHLFDAIYSCLNECSYPVIIVSTIKNIGPGGARNLAVNISDQFWVAIMDSDDYCIPDRFEKQINYLVSNEVDVLGGLIEEVMLDNSGKFFSKIRHVPLSHSDISKGLKSKACVNNVTAIIKRSCYLSVGGYPELRYGEDYVFWCRIINFGGIIQNLNTTLVVVHVDSGFFYRRVGFDIFLKEFKYQRVLYSDGFFGTGNFLIKIVKSLILRSIPRPIAKMLYLKFRR